MYCVLCTGRHSPAPHLRAEVGTPCGLRCGCVQIYRRTYKGGKYIAPDSKLDWAANLSHMMGGWPRGS